MVQSESRKGTFDVSDSPNIWIMYDRKLSTANAKKVAFLLYVFSYVASYVSGCFGRNNLQRPRYSSYRPGLAGRQGFDLHHEQKETSPRNGYLPDVQVIYNIQIGISSKLQYQDV